MYTPYIFNTNFKITIIFTETPPIKHTTTYLYSLYNIRIHKNKQHIYMTK